MRFSSGYFPEADNVGNLRRTIDRAMQVLHGVEFDTIVGTGFSGGIVVPALSMEMDKMFVLVRKETDDSHHGGGRMVGELGERWLFVDDFISMGRTRQRVMSKVQQAWERETKGYPSNRRPFYFPFPQYVGDYLYGASDPEHPHEVLGRYVPVGKRITVMRTKE